MSPLYPYIPAPELGSEPVSRWRGAARYLMDWRVSLSTAERACCCASKPAVVAIMPPAAGRPLPTDLLLCSNHYRASGQALAAAHAAVLDTNGVPLTPYTQELLRPRG